MIKKLLDMISTKDELDAIGEYKIKLMQAEGAKIEAEYQKQAAMQQTAAQHIHSNPYANAAGGAYNYGTTSSAGVHYGTIYHPVGGGGGVPTAIPYVIPGSINNNVNAVWTTAAVPSPTGTIVTITVTDANGFDNVMEIDAAYYDTMNYISMMHRQRIASRPKCLPDPDFDLDDMEKAAELLEGLDGPRPEG